MKKDELDDLRSYYDNTSLPESVDRAELDDRVIDEVLVSTCSGSSPNAPTRQPERERLRPHRHVLINLAGRMTEF